MSMFNLFKKKKAEPEKSEGRAAEGRPDLPGTVVVIRPMLDRWLIEKAGPDDITCKTVAICDKPEEIAKTVAKVFGKKKAAKTKARGGEKIK